MAPFLAAAAWWEDDFAFLCIWAVVLAIALAGRRESSRQVLGTVFFIAFIGGWVANNEQQKPLGSTIPMATDVIFLTALISGIAYLVVRYRHRGKHDDRSLPDGDDTTSPV